MSVNLNVLRSSKVTHKYRSNAQIEDMDFCKQLLMSLISSNKLDELEISNKSAPRDCMDPYLGVELPKTVTRLEPSA